MDKEYYIFIRGIKIAVTKEQYYAYKRPEWRERKKRRLRAENEMSLEALAGRGYEPEAGQRIIESTENRLLLQEALTELTQYESSLVKAFAYAGKTEREAAKEAGKPRKTMTYQRNKALEKLRNKISENN